jgi:Protein of unknown function (DUF998)
VTDPVSGHPPGTPGHLPAYSSAPAALHDLVSVGTFVGLPLASLVLARRFAGWGQRRWAAYSAATGIDMAVGTVLTSMAFNQVEPLVQVGGLLQRTTVTIGWTWLTPARHPPAQGAVRDRGELHMTSTVSIDRPRWLLWVTLGSILAPLPSALWRLGLATGLSMGFSGQRLRGLDVPGWGSVYVVGLSTVSMGLALLALGLIRSWEGGRPLMDPGRWRQAGAAAAGGHPRRARERGGDPADRLGGRGTGLAGRHRMASPQGLADPPAVAPTDRRLTGAGVGRLADARASGVRPVTPGQRRRAAATEIGDASDRRRRGVATAPGSAHG